MAILKLHTSLAITGWLMLMSMGTIAVAQEETAPKQTGGFLDSLYKNLFGGSEKTAPSVDDPFSSPPTQEGFMEAVGNVDDRAGQTGSGEQKRIDVLDNFEEAIKLSQLEQRPLLLIAGAQWCTWCRKLEQELKLDDADELLMKWIVVKIDVDDAPSLAEEFEVSSLPALRVLSADRRIAAKREGYLPIAELETWLGEVAPQVDPSVTRVLYDHSTPDEEQLAKLIEFLGNRSPSIRQSATARLVSTRAVSAKPVVAILGQGRLAQRLCALDILRHWGAPVENLDPWEPDSIHSEHLDDLNAWLESHPVTDAETAAPVPEATVDPQKIKDTITQLLIEPEAKRRLLMTQALSYGRAVVPELRARLENADGISDDHKVLLKQVLLSSLASAKTRDTHASLISAVASLNPDTHRKAAARLIELLDLPDRDLVEELADDADPLVRESAVPALQRMGALHLPERLSKLLGDKSPSVRTAVLREIAENASTHSVELLCEHAMKETDEDLLVYTAKTLGELGQLPKAEDTLCQLLQNSSWRVRAAALDAFAKRAEHRSDYSTAVVTSTVFDAVVKAAGDSDAFVMKRATELVPKLTSTSNAKSVVNFLLERPGTIELFWKEVPEYERSDLGKTLASAALSVLDETDSSKMAGAITLITAIDAARLKSRLPELLKSPEALVRIAALKGSVAYLETVRREQLTKLAAGGEERVAMELQPWYPVPETFLTLPDPPKAPDAESAAVQEQRAAAEAQPEQTPIPAELAAVDDFFGGKPAPTPLPVENKPSEPSEQLLAGLDAAEQLFGAVPKAPAEVSTDSTRTEPTDANAPAADATAAAPGAVAVGKSPKLLSSWLDDWYEQYATESGLESVEVLRKQLRESVDSLGEVALLQEPQNLQQVEATWLTLANLASGRKELAARLALPERLVPLNAPPSPSTVSMPVAREVLSWLPPDLMFQCFDDYQFDWKTDFPEDDQELFKAVTLMDNRSVADWVLEQVGSRSLSEPQFLAISSLLARALRGHHEVYQRLNISVDALRGKSPFKGHERPAIGSRAALEWLTEQHKRELSPEQRALLLVQLACFDYRVGSQSAVGCVASAMRWDREVEVATILALGSEATVAADRAVQWLTHPVAEVRAAALHRLARPSDEVRMHSWTLGVPQVQDNDGEIPLFFVAVRPISDAASELLTTQMKNPDETVAWDAYILLLASGKEDLDEWKEEDLQSEQYVTISGALAKARRKDDAAIAFYERAAAHADYFGQRAIEKMLKNISDPKIKALRKRMGPSYPSPF